MAENFPRVSGAYDTVIYVAPGRVRLEYGARGHDVTEGAAGAFLHVPAGLIHRESNPGDTSNSLVLIRVGTGPTLFDVAAPA